MMHKPKYNLAPESIKRFSLPNDMVHDKPLRSSETELLHQDKDLFHSWNYSSDKDLKGEHPAGISKGKTEEKTKQNLSAEGH